VVFSADGHDFPAAFESGPKMKVSLSWLSDYVAIEKDVVDLADALTMAGLEVGAICDRYDYLRTVFVGRVVTVKPHPNTEKLKVCEVDIGDRIIPVVCGAPNVDRNMLAPLALPGTLLTDGSSLKSGIIRGQQSEGMLCSESELGLGPEDAGLMNLDPSLCIGKPLAEALGLADAVLELELTPNRPDCLSMIGVAREVAAIQKNRIKYPDIVLPKSIYHITDKTSVSIEAPAHCPRYAARLLIDLTVGPSPFWMKDRLLSIGIRPINNIVDITNFVMMETGQPLHAFDFDRLAENRIVVRTAQDGEVFTTLDQKERVLSRDMLLICDGKKPVAIAGIMGGLNSEIGSETRRVLIESACFDPVSIRKTSKKLGLATEASHRFERGVDPETTVAAADRAAQLMAAVGGRLIDGVIDEHPGRRSRTLIRLGLGETRRVLGVGLDQNTMSALLRSIEFEVKADGDGILSVLPPSFRLDIRRPEDLMEEVARLSGYDNIPTTFPLIRADTRRFSRSIDLRKCIRAFMTGFGFTETINYSFIHELSCDRLGLSKTDFRRNTIRVLNPLTEEQSVMRTSLIPGLLGTLQRNITQQIKHIKIFEVGKVFIGKGDDNLPEEIEMLAGLWTGTRQAPCWCSHGEDCDFYDIKGVVEELLERLKIGDLRFTRLSDEDCTYTRPGRTARILFGEEILGLVGEVAFDVRSHFTIKQPVFLFELNLELLSGISSEIRFYRPIPRYPSASRDLTVIVDKDLETGAIIAHARDFGEHLVEDIHLFDVFEGDPIPPGKKSISLRITYRSSSETLLDETVNALQKKIAMKFVETFGALLPG